MRSACLRGQMDYSGRARKGSQPIARFDSGGRTTCVSMPDPPAAISGKVLVGQNYRANRLPARRRMLAFLVSPRPVRADVVQWQNISFPS